MILKWGRRGLVAGAITATFVTPVPNTAGVNQASVRPSHTLEFKHVTPVDAAVGGVHRAYLRNDSQFEFRYITPVDEPDTPTAGGRSGSRNLLWEQILREDEELLVLIASSLRAMT